MKRTPSKTQQMGFTLIEMLVAMGIFLLICGAAFTLLGTSQQRYRTESQVLNSFQEARLGLDQIVRDVNDAGFPPPTFASANPNLSASSPFAWSFGYPNAPCLLGPYGGGTCSSIPGDFELIIETNPNPQDPGSTVQWIRYKLKETTLMRGMAGKVLGDDPVFDTDGFLVPFVQNVINNPSPDVIAQYQAIYPGMFPGGKPVPVFTYTCDTPTVPQPPATSCSAAGPDNSPANIREVAITLIVATPLPDATTGNPRVVTLSGRGRRVNPNR